MTETAKIIPIESTAVALYEITKEEITSMVSQFADLKVIPDDKKSYERVDDARKVLKKLRNKLENRRKDLGAEYRKKLEDINAQGKELIALVEPAEIELSAKLANEDARIQAIEDAKVKAEMERVEKIRAQIQKIKDLAIVTIDMKSTDISKRFTDLDKTRGLDFEEFEQEANTACVEAMSKISEAFDKRVAWEKAEEDRRAEAARLEEQRKAQEAERQRLEAEKKAAEEAARKEREALEAEQKAARDKIEAERRALELEKQAMEREKQAEAARKEKEAREIREAEERKQREAKEKAEREGKERIRKEREEALKPEKERLNTWLDDIYMSIPEIALQTEALIIARDKFIENLIFVIRDTKKEVEAL